MYANKTKLHYMQSFAFSLALMMRFTTIRKWLIWPLYRDLSAYPLSLPRGGEHVQNCGQFWCNSNGLIIISFSKLYIAQYNNYVRKKNSHVRKPLFNYFTIWMHFSKHHSVRKNWQMSMTSTAKCIFWSHRTTHVLINCDLRTVPTSVTAHTFCTSRDTRVSYKWVVPTNIGIFLRGLKLYGEGRT